MISEREIDPGDSTPKQNETASRQTLPLVEHAEKGSLSSMWELLMQLRVLLPYLARLVPLLDRGLVKAAPDLSEVHKGMREIETGSRDLSVQVRNHGLQLERIEEQTLRLREIAERGLREAQGLSEGVQALRTWVRILALLTLLLLAGAVVMTALQFSHFGR